MIPPSGDAPGGVRLFLKTPEAPILKERRVVAPPVATQGRSWGWILWVIDGILVILAFGQLLARQESGSFNLSLLTGASLIGVAAVVGVVGVYLHRFGNR